MSYVTDRYNLKKLSSQSLAVTECGIQICNSGHATPPIYYGEYAVHFILEGQGVFKVNGKTYALSAGQGFLITPLAKCEYTADSQKPWKYVYACFSGVDDDALVHSAGLSEEDVVFNFPLDDDTVRDIYAMHSAGKRNDAKGYDVTGYFLLVMSRLVRFNGNNDNNLTQAERYVKKAKRYIEDNYSFSITVADVANNLCLDRTYLYRLFIKYEGVSPSQYLSDYRIEKAGEMLIDKNLSINDVSTSVGFKYVAYSYKAFYIKYKTTPKKYRQNFKFLVYF
jgi:AraC-like DNA-binding protein